MLHNKFHREDGPAVIHLNGDMEWWLHNKLHREDGPAIIRPDGDMDWWLNHKLHREDGPAIIRPNGDMEWWIEGNKIKEFKLSNFETKEPIFKTKTTIPIEKVIRKIV